MSEPTTSNVDMSRRKILIGGAFMAAAANLPAAAMAATDKKKKLPHLPIRAKEGIP